MSGKLVLEIVRFCVVFFWNEVLNEEDRQRFKLYVKQELFNLPSNLIKFRKKF